jgi:hypothetical protein
MFFRVREYGLIDIGQRWYRPRAYGAVRPDDMWDGWLVFFPSGGAAIAPAGPETTQDTFEALTVWAAGLRAVYLEGALARALELAQQPPLVTQLADAEYAALKDAYGLDTAAAVEHAGAEIDKAATDAARIDAEPLLPERLTAEGVLAVTKEGVAKLDAPAQDRARRRRSVAAGARPRADTTRGRKKT